MKVCGTKSLFALCSCISCVLLVSCGNKRSTAPTASPALPAREVRTIAAAIRPMPQSVFAVGTLAAQERSTLSAKVSGRLQEINVDIGTPVKAGMLLARIEPRDYELRLAQASAALAQSRAALGLSPEAQDESVELALIPGVKEAVAVRDEAQKSLKRIQDLAKSGIAPQSELDKAFADFTVAQAKHDTAMEEARTRVAALAQSRAEFDLAKKQLQDTAIVAPFDGAIQSRRASLGEYLAPGAPIVEIVKTDPLRLRLEVPERAATLIRTGQVVHLWVESDTNTYSGTIARLSPALDEQTRMLLVEADVPAVGSLRAGLFARAEIVTAADQPGLSVPPNTIVTFAGLQKVVAVRDGKALEKTITLGRKGPGWIEVTSGLQNGDRVVLDPAGINTGQSLRLLDQIPSPVAANTGSNDAKAR